MSVETASSAEMSQVPPMRDLSAAVALAAHRAVADVAETLQEEPQPTSGDSSEAIELRWVAGRYMDLDGKVWTFGEVKAAGEAVTIRFEEEA